jgi:hypothetical protein
VPKEEPAGSQAQLGLNGPNPAFLGIGVLVVIARSVRAARLLGSCLRSLGSAVLRRDALSSFSWPPWQTLVNWPVINDVLPGGPAVLAYPFLASASLA